VPGRHVTDHQMRLFMKFRQTNTTAVAAAKTSISTATAYRIEKDSRLPSLELIHKRRNVATLLLAKYFLGKPRNKLVGSILRCGIARRLAMDNRTRNCDRAPIPSPDPYLLKLHLRKTHHLRVGVLLLPRHPRLALEQHGIAKLVRAIVVLSKGRGNLI
jgi:hypothetical protein